MKNTVLIVINFLFAQFIFSQQTKVISHVEENDLAKSIAQHDTLLEQYKVSPFLLEIQNTKENLKNRDTVKTLTHLDNFYKSNEVFTYDSIHAKKQLHEIHVLIDQEIEHELKKSIGCDLGHAKKILPAARKAIEKGENEKALEFYRRHILLFPNDIEVKNEYQIFKAKYQNSQK